jgi:hypothetical protein
MTVRSDSSHLAILRPTGSASRHDHWRRLDISRGLPGGPLIPADKSAPISTLLKCPHANLKLRIVRSGGAPPIGTQRRLN